MRPLLALILCLSAAAAKPGSGASKFAQLEPELPTPTEVRLASGAPGPQYWQQRADYEIDATLDEAKRRITGQVTITYYNNSPHRLDYLWLQLDQNIFKRHASPASHWAAPGFEEFSYKQLARALELERFAGGFDIESVKDRRGDPIPHTIVETMMRLDLDEPLRPGRSVRFEIKWAHNINNAAVVRARGGYEHFEEDGNDIYTIAQWYPRMAAYDDVDGWQNKQFLGRGEFTLEMGDYEVRLTVPADHIVAATGVLDNPSRVLSGAQRDRLEQAEEAGRPVFIVTKDEAIENEKDKAKGTKTWVFEAENVRDFAFASSRKFVWDAMSVRTGDRDKKTLAMSFYPKEGMPLWDKYSTHAVAHTIEVYGRMTVAYPYPVAISVNGPVGGMEYPMICFNGPRAEEDGTYYDRWGEGKRWDRSKYGLISVIIHEVGHNWFPMIINSDERQWTWMDEGLNSFLQFIAEQEWEKDYPSWRGIPKNIVGYMKSGRAVPIMTNSESLLQFGNNAYGKPATALNILRETILGRELFDFAFKKYAQRWWFKRPMPADLFRTMEDASGIDLDWFWRGWFYSVDPVDIAIVKVREFVMDTRNPEIDKQRRRKEKEEEQKSISEIRNKDLRVRTQRFPELKDFYNEYDPLDVTAKDRKDYEKLLDDLEPDERSLLEVERHFYLVEFENQGGLVMPIIVRVEYEDGTRELHRIPAEIWRMDADRVSKLFITKQPIKALALDPFEETADIDTSDNNWPPKARKSRFQLFKQKHQPNAMKAARKAEAEARKAEAEAAKERVEETKAKVEGEASPPAAKEPAEEKPADEQADDS